MIVSLAGLFASFIALCGNTHTLNVFRHFYPNSVAVQYAQAAMLVICALVSIATAGVSYKLFPLILEVLRKFELNSEGNLQHVENYLVEVVEMVKESIVVFGEDLKISRCNEASKTLLNCGSLVGQMITDFVHPEDVRAFEEAMLVALSGYSQTPVTLEYRICREVATFSDLVTPDSSIKPYNLIRASSGTRKIHASIELPPVQNSSPKQISNSTLSASMPTIVTGLSESNFSAGSKLPGSTEYVWVESTVCKGIRLSHSDDFDYDLKMVTRNIEDRKRQAQTQLENILRATEEQARINAAKLRYISCIAHDLKTPLQSFCFSLDLLQQTPMHAEQRECVQQANVAVDLMKLTISQTMDISKALSGAKLTPRCTTVSLPSVLDRVKVIMYVALSGMCHSIP
jgi:PAS domain-containing protein